MNRLLRVMTRPITSSSTDVRLVQFACWLVSLMMLVFGMRELAELPATEIELYFGVLLIMILVLLGVLIGLVFPNAVGRAKGSN